MIDIDKLRELNDAIGSEAVKSILNVFLNELDMQLSEIHICLELQQTNRIADIAHVLKSTSATFGATELTDIALRIETAARQQQVDELDLLVKIMKGCILKTKPLYRSYTEKKE